MHPRGILPIAAQVAGLRSYFPFGKVKWDRFRLNWKGLLSPSELGRNYEVELSYTKGHLPDVWVREPNLRQLAGERTLPHTYDQKQQQLCLFLPTGKYWRPDRSLAITLVPWACLWLYYFELWLITDEWSGTGEHPVPRQILQKPIPLPRTVILF